MNRNNMPPPGTPVPGAAPLPPGTAAAPAPPTAYTPQATVLTASTSSSGMGEWRNAVKISPSGGRSTILVWPSQCGPGAGGQPPAAVVQVTSIIDLNGVAAQATDSIAGAFVTIAWGGVGHEVELDLSGGISFPVTGSVTVSVTYPIDATVNQPTILVRASIGVDGTNGMLGRMTRTKLVTTSLAANTLSALIEIPPLAAGVSLQQTTAALPGLEIRQYTNSNTASLVMIDQTSKSGSTPIVDGARFFAVFNPSATTAFANVRAVFAISNESLFNGVALGVARAAGALSVGEVRALMIDTNTGGTGTTEQQAPVAEDNTAGVIWGAQKATSSATNAMTSVPSTALEASHVLKNAAGRLYELNANQTAGANTATFLQLYNSTTVPADTAVPVWCASMPIATANQATSNYDKSWALGKYFSTGIAVAGSTTQATKTVVGAIMWFNSELA